MEASVFMTNEELHQDIPKLLMAADIIFKNVFLKLHFLLQDAELQHFSMSNLQKFNIKVFLGLFSN